ncbi:DUF262 domain-containing protein [Romboutsia sedimentorum]|uniref:HNH endonuclease family protein n=1 Tax=Romboutsia sedimentorum TaxID=1368474 RepID=UPI0024DE68B0|nr:DUF262 domain-containing protein [Romboutsia sedimentorum]MDK2584447.1 DUF262 domain-containing protein [Romboutsia sedimentorum]
MRVLNTPYAVYSINNRKHRINPQPQYQRGPVWTVDKQQKLIDSILRGYDIPKFYLRKVSTDYYDFEVLDGQQRLRAIWSFWDNEYPLNDTSFDLPSGNLSGKYFRDLTSNDQDLIGSFSLCIAEVMDATDSEVGELFLRLQEGASLNPAEKRNAMIGEMRDSIDSISKYPIFPKTTVINKRFEYADLVSHIVCLELNGGPTDVKSTNLKKMYEKNEKLDANASKKINKVKKVLNYMNKIFASPTPELKIKWGFVDLYLLISKLIDEYDISNRHIDFFDFYISFELERRKALSDTSALLTSNPSDWGKDLYNYIEAFQKEGANRSNLEIRHKVYISNFLNKFTNLAPKDSKRLFDENQKLILWRKANMKCKLCNICIDLKDMHADHIVPHSKGGKTIIDNGQCLCSNCNLSKSNKI